MKCKPIITFILLLASVFCYSQNMPNVITAEELVDMYKNLMEEREEPDSLSELFTQKFIDYLTVKGSNLDQNEQAFDTLNGFHTKTSQDKKLKIISWDTHTGGTMRFYHTVYQYQTDSGLKMKKYLSGFDCEGKDVGSGSYVMDIFQMDNKGVRYYLPVTQSIHSIGYHYQGIRAIIIRDNELDDNVKIFKTKEGLQNNINIEYNFFSVVDRKERPIFLFKYDEHKKQLKAALVDDEENVLNKWKVIKMEFNAI